MFLTHIHVLKASTGVTCIKFCGHSKVPVKDLILQINHCCVDFKTKNVSKEETETFPT